MNKIIKKQEYYDNFYEWANYDWLNTSKIPRDDVGINNFKLLQDKINNVLAELIYTDDLKLSKKFYDSYLNWDYRNENSINQLKKIINIVDSISSYKDLILFSHNMLKLNISIFLHIYVDISIFDSSKYILYVGQTNLGLPDRNYYSKPDIIKNYYKMICLLYKNIDSEFKNYNDIAKMIIEIETKMAIIISDKTENRDVDKVYHNKKYQDMIDSYPKLYFKDLIKTLEINPEYIIANYRVDEDYFKNLSNLIGEYSVDSWKEYIKFKIMLSNMNNTTKELKDIHFNFYNKILRGQTIQKSDKKIALLMSVNYLSDQVSRKFTELYFNSNVEAYMIKMVSNIKKGTELRIKNLDWMSEETKKKAIIKLNKIKLKLGYSKDEPRNYSDIKLTNCLLTNKIIVNIDNVKFNLNKLNKPKPIDEWESPAYEVNAFYNATNNEIIFPTSILHPPFLDLSKDDIYNYAHIGAIIGHELIHPFDDQGSKFDGDGNIKNWWSKSDNKKFKEKVNKIIDIYTKEGINGKLTAGENIADFGAIVMPLNSLRYSLGRELKDEEYIKFYKDYASLWKSLHTKEIANEKLLTDPHSNSCLRVNIPLKHQIEFQRVYNIKPNHKMYVNPDDMLSIW
jgi:putative endopeptidase